MYIAVMAGTPFDTQMGMEFIEQQGYKAKAYALSKTPDEQSALQVLYPNKLEKIVIEKIEGIKREGINNLFVYCNSLSGAVDMEKLSIIYKINIITPLQIYREIAKKHKIVAVLAANNQSAFAIEKVIQESNPETYVVGIGVLPLVNAIEKKKSPNKIMEQFALEEILEFFSRLKCEAIILGCTHFPYLYNEIIQKTNLPIIDPAYEMIKKIKTD